MKTAAFFLLIALLVVAILPAVQAFYPRFFRAPLKAGGVAEKPTAKDTKTAPVVELRKGDSKKEEEEGEDKDAKKLSPFGALVRPRQPPCPKLRPLARSSLRANHVPHSLKAV